MPLKNIARITIYGRSQQRSNIVVASAILGAIAGTIVGAMAPGECVRAESETDRDSTACYVRPLTAVGGGVAGLGLGLALGLPLTADWRGHETRPR